MKPLPTDRCRGPFNSLRVLIRQMGWLTIWLIAWAVALAVVDGIGELLP